MASCRRLALLNTARRTFLARSAHSHAPRPLPYPVEHGLGSFLPPPALQALSDYQAGLLQRLETELRSDPAAEAHSTVAQTVVNLSKRKERTLAFNYAVLALNNHFFLDNLTPPSTTATDHSAKIDLTLLERIRAHYGDLPRLKSSFSAAALGMFTNGWVWFVTNPSGRLAILPTFGPSTLLVRSRMNVAQTGLIFGEDRVAHDPPPHLASDAATTPGASEDPMGSASSPPTPSVGSNDVGHRDGASSPLSGIPFTSASTNPPPLDATLSFAVVVCGTDPVPYQRLRRTEADGLDSSGLDEVLYPLFCVPTYEHAWMSAGYGIWGKEDWLKEFGVC